MMLWKHRTVLFHLAVLISAISALGQASGPANIGTPENSALHGGDIDAVQLNNGGLTVNIDLIGSPGRSLSTGYRVVYNSKVWRLNQNCSDTQCVDSIRQTGSPLPINIVGPLLNAAPVGHSTYTQFCNGANAVVSNNYTIREIDGTLHHFVPDGTGLAGCNIPSNIDRYADDGSGWMIKGGTLAIRKDGISTSGSSITTTTVRDTNGNQILSTFNPNTQTTTSVDSLGRNIPPLGYYDANGNLQTLQVQYVSLTVQTQLCPPSPPAICNEKSTTWTVPSTITLPNGLHYSFGYETTNGQLTSITLPTGAVISYSYAKTFFDANTPDSSGWRIQTRTVTAGGQSYIWRYSYSFGPGTSTTTVIDPLNDQTVYQYTSIPPGGAAFTTTSPDAGPYSQITEVDYYTGNGSGAQLLKKVQTEYWNAEIIKPKATTTTIYSTVPGDNTVTKSRTESDYDTQTISAWDTLGNPVVAHVTRGNETELRDFSYDSLGNNPLLVRRTHFSYLSDSNSQYLSANISDRVADKAVYDCITQACMPPSTVGSYGTSYSGGKLASEIQYGYDDTPILNADGLISPPASVPGHDDVNYPTSFTVRGNLTHTNFWLDSSSTWLTIIANYDLLGNMISSIDANGHLIAFDYSDDWNGWNTNISCLPSLNSFAFITDIKNALNQHVHRSYFPCTGQIQSSKDQNDINAARPGTSYTYDLMKRPLAQTFPDGGQAAMCYSEISGAACYNGGIPLKVVSTKTITASASMVNTSILDGLARVIQTQLNSDPQGIDYLDIAYDELGRQKTISNPYRSTADSTYGTTAYFYDALGRVTLVVPADGTQTVNDVGIQYGGNYTITTDQARNKARRVYDSFGRLVQVWEDPAGLNYETDYNYDILNNLLRVDQKGSAPTDNTQWRTRTFSYDSLSRLVQSNNPESGSIYYFYDNMGNLLQKVLPSPNQAGAAQHTLSYCYDELNRVTGVAYSWQNCQGTQLPPGTAQFTYTYDAYAGATQGSSVGRLVRAGGATTGGHYFWYDPRGRITGTWQCLPSDCSNGASVSAQYDFLGNLTQLQYPNGSVVVYASDAGGRQISAIDNSNNINFATSATYGPDSSITGVINGQTPAFAGIFSTFVYNKRLQPCRIAVSNTSAVPADCLAGWGNVMDLGYDFHLGNGDNGNVYGITRWGDQTRTKTFGYDSLNRLSSAQNAGTDCTVVLPDGHTKFWGNSYSYDAWGNLLQKIPTKCTSDNLTVVVDSRNQIHTIGLPDYAYDAAGNMMHDAVTGNNYVYDNENRIVSFANTTYTYDAQGNRLRKDTTGTSTEYITFGANVIAEKTVSTGAWTNYIFIGSKRIARHDPNGSVFYYFSDHLNSTSVITDAAGNITADYDLDPWGSERQAVSGDANHYKFAGKERDAESTLDYFGARYYSSPVGRFITPDWADTPEPIPYARLSSPQSLNLFAYALNNPTTFFDIDGHFAGLLNPTALSYSQGDDHPQHMPCNAEPTPLCGEIEKARRELEEYRKRCPTRACRWGKKAGELNRKIEQALAPWTHALENVLYILNPCKNPDVSCGIAYPVGGMGMMMDAELAETSGILREAAAAKGFAPEMGTAPVVTAARAQQIGEAWVGPGYKLSSDGSCLISADGLRVYRLPAYKPRLGMTQANLEKRIFDTKTGKPFNISNYHINLQ